MLAAALGLDPGQAREGFHRGAEFTGGEDNVIEGDVGHGLGSQRNREEAAQQR
jgi:hypothetical protein